MQQKTELYSLIKTPIKIYASYRFLLSCIFVVIALTTNKYPFENVSLTLITSTFYFVIATIFFVGTLFQYTLILKHTYIGFIIDIISIAFLEYTSLNKGVSLDLVLIVSVAAGSIVFSGALGMAIAACATIALCIKEFALNDIFGISDPAQLRTSLLGITFFATAWITQNLAKKLIESDALSSQQAKDIQKLEDINKAIIERMNTGVVVFNKEMKPIVVNQAAQQLLSPDPAQKLAPETGIAILEEKISYWRTQEQKEVQTLQMSAHTPELKIGFTYLSNEQQVITFIEDNSKIKQHAQQLKLASLGQLAASIAHEIRNPLAAVSYSSQLMLESTLDDNQNQLVHIILKHIRRMNDIVDNVLQISRRQPPQQTIIQLNSWIRSFVQAVFPAESAIHIQDHQQVSVEFDPSHLSQVCTNLIENALNALRQNSSNTTNISALITIEIGYISSINRVFLNIADKGPGIPNSQLNHIFEPFFTTSTQGSGLGLFLCREICELNHARVHTLPQEVGTCFQILFKPRNLDCE